MQLIPTFPDAFYTEVVNLDGTDYLLDFRYNQRENCYYLNVGTPDGTAIVNGIKMVSTWPLLNKYAYDGLPPGDLIVFANTVDKDPAPGLGEIGEGCKFTLYYLTATELINVFAAEQ